MEQRHRDRINLVLGKEIDTSGIGYNIDQSKIAISNGGLFGTGFLEGTQTKGNFVPRQHTDFIFSTIGEEWGFIGTIITIIFFSFLIIRIITRADKQPNHFRRIYSHCFASLLFFPLFSKYWNVNRINSIYWHTFTIYKLWWVKPVNI